MTSSPVSRTLFQVCAAPRALRVGTRAIPGAFHHGGRLRFRPARIFRHFIPAWIIDNLFLFGQIIHTMACRHGATQAGKSRGIQP